LKRIELSTSSLPRKCSTPELQRLVKSRDLPYTSQSGRRGSNPRPTAWKAVALPTELLPLFNNLRFYTNLTPRFDASRKCGTSNSWARMDSNHRTRKRTDLQSVAVGHLATCPFTLGTPPHFQCLSGGSRLPRAREGTRTPDQLITNQLLYQLSYSGL
jgi:hypothetical protein